MGKFTDNRDGKVYKWIKIANQVWMAENLSYEVFNNDSPIILITYVLIIGCNDPFNLLIRPLVSMCRECKELSAQRANPQVAFRGF